jgi:excisionase family DNA binding protein
MSEKMTMNVSEMAEQLGISKPKAYELVKRDSFPSIFLGKRIVIPTAALKMWLIENSTTTDEHNTIINKEIS